LSLLLEGEVIGIEKMNLELLNTLMNHILSYFSERKEIINKINVFPVPDGDTGTNIELTIKGALEYVNKFLKGKGEEISPNEYIRKLAEGMALNSHGCSGAILSLYFQGLANALDLENISNENIVEALRQGYENAYKGTINPQEGTMLTLMREFYRKYEELSRRYSDPLLIVRDTMPYLKTVLENTLPNQLSILRKAGVTDSGALGFYVLLEGFLDFFEKRGQLPSRNEGLFFIELLMKTLGLLRYRRVYDPIRLLVNKTLRHLEPRKEVALLKQMLKKYRGRRERKSAWTRNVHYKYCTEFLLKPKVENIELTQITLRLKPFGDEVFAVRSSNAFKVHIHTNSPEKVLGAIKDVGAVDFLKIDNMVKQQRKVVSEIFSNQVSYNEATTNAVLLIVNGKGFENIVRSFGYSDVFAIAYEGIKPPALKIAEKVEKFEAENILIVVDSIEILQALASETELFDHKRTVIIIYEDVAESLHALYNYYEDMSFEEKVKLFSESRGAVKFFKVKKVVKNVSGAERIEYYSIYKDEVLSRSSAAEEAIYEAILKIKEGETLATLYRGNMEKEEKKELLNNLKNMLKDFNFELYYGGQDTYSYYVVIE